MTTKALNIFSLSLVALAISLVVTKNLQPTGLPTLLNVSYDPTREAYQEINAAFVEKYEKETGQHFRLEQSHGGSSRQSRAVAEGLAADVVTLALPSDIQALADRGFIAHDWAGRFPNASQPYFSTIVFVVRKSNPRNIKDWPDLITPGIAIVTPDPKTSGNGKLSVLAAWGSVIRRGGSEDEARAFLTQLYGHAAFQGQGAREAATKFALEKEGDVHLTWENEALREIEESKGELEIVYPQASIRAEPSVTWVDAYVAKHHSEAAAKAYLAFLFTGPAQEIFARHGYRPSSDDVLAKHRDQFPKIDLFPITLLANDWNEAQTKFFGENGIFEIIRPSSPPYSK